MLRLAASAAIGAAAASGVWLAWLWAASPSSFNECVLREMRGRNDSMMQFAARHCRQVFPEPPKAAGGMFDDLIPGAAPNE